MGTMGLVVITPLMAVSCLSSAEDETTNFIWVDDLRLGGVGTGKIEGQM
jgi:hypothetical protein